MDNFKEIERIENYLLGNLDEQAQQAFEKEMAADAALQKEVQFHQYILKGIQKGEDKTLKTAINQTTTNLEVDGFFREYEKVEETVPLEKKEPTIVKPIFSKQLLYIAASLLVLIVAAFYVWPTLNKQNHDLFSKYFKIDKAQLDNKISSLSSFGIGNPDQVSNHALRNALKDYKSCSDLPCAYNSFANYQKDFPKDETPLFYIALSNMEADKYIEATKIWEQLSKNKKSEWASSAYWYLGLTYLKVPDKEEKGLTIFREIATDINAPYSKEAQDLLEEYK